MLSDQSVPPFDVVPVDPGDPAALEAVLHVYEQCDDFLALGPNLASMEMVRADLAHASAVGSAYCAILVRQTGEVAGIVDFQIAGFEGSPTTASLELLMIAAPWRGRGLGARVVAWVENTIAAGGQVERICSGVQVNNPSAIRFWLRMGYQIVSGPRDMGDGTTAVALEKWIGTLPPRT